MFVYGRQDRVDLARLEIRYHGMDNMHASSKSEIDFFELILCNTKRHRNQCGFASFDLSLWLVSKGAVYSTWSISLYPRGIGQRECTFVNWRRRSLWVRYVGNYICTHISLI